MGVSASKASKPRSASHTHAPDNGEPANGPRAAVSYFLQRIAAFRIEPDIAE